MMAIALGEDDAELYASVLSSSSHVFISAGTFLECCVVIQRKSNPIVRQLVDDLIDSQPIEIVDVTVSQAWRGRRAFQDFGQTSGHPAQLNFGDCFAYALAKDFQEPLLFKGNDFAETDVRSALAEFTSQD